MSGKLCLTPTTISSDIPNKACVDRRWQRWTQKTLQSSHRLQPRKKKVSVCVLGGTFGDHGAENMQPLKFISWLTFPRRTQTKHHVILMNLRY